MTKKRILSAVIAATMMISLSGCQFKYEEDMTQASEENVTTPAPGSNTIRVLYNNNQYKKYFEKCKKEFEKENDVTIILEYVDNSDYLEEISSRSTSSDRVPDVYLIDNGNLGTAYLAGLASKLTVTQDVTDGFCDNAISACSYNGNLVAYPLGFKTTFLAYNSAYVEDGKIFTFNDITDYADNVEFIETEGGQHIEKIFSCNLAPLKPISRER